MDNIYIRFDTKLYRQIVGIPIGTNCVPLLTGLFLFFYENVIFIQADILEAFNLTSRYLEKKHNKY